MIGLDSPATVWCDSPGCTAVQPARLVLLVGGGFGAVPQTTTWQVLRAPSGAFLARCPEHIMRVEQAGPSGRTIPTAEAFGTDTSVSR